MLRFESHNNGAYVGAEFTIDKTDGYVINELWECLIKQLVQGELHPSGGKRALDSYVKIAVVVSYWQPCQ